MLVVRMARSDLICGCVFESSLILRQDNIALSLKIHLCVEDLAAVHPLLL